MVGGTVTEVLKKHDRIWVNTAEDHDECAIFIERNTVSESVKLGDSLWWQGENAYWTPVENHRRPESELKCGTDFDIAIPRIGYSGVNHPAKSMIDSAYPKEKRQ